MGLQKIHDGGIKSEWCALKQTTFQILAIYAAPLMLCSKEVNELSCMTDLPTDP